MIYINGKLAPARKINVGDQLTTLSGWKRVTAVQMDETCTGLYNPQTMHGDIVVDDVVVSTFTTAVDIRIATGLLLPFRALFRASAIDENVAGRWFQEGVFSSFSFFS